MVNNKTIIPKQPPKGVKPLTAYFGRVTNPQSPGNSSTGSSPLKPSPQKSRVGASPPSKQMGQSVGKMVDVFGFGENEEDAHGTMLQRRDTYGMTSSPLRELKTDDTNIADLGPSPLKTRSTRTRGGRWETVGPRVEGLRMPGMKMVETLIDLTEEEEDVEMPLAWFVGLEVVGWEMNEMGVGLLLFDDDGESSKGAMDMEPIRVVKENPKTETVKEDLTAETRSTDMDAPLTGITSICSSTTMVDIPRALTPKKNESASMMREATPVTVKKGDSTAMSSTVEKIVVTVRGVVDSDDDEDLMDTSMFDFLKPVEDISKSIELLLEQGQLSTPSTTRRNPSSSSTLPSSAATRQSTRTRAVVNYKAPPLDPFDEIERFAERVQMGTRGMSLDSLFRDRQKRLRMEERVEELGRGVVESSDDETQSTPRKRRNLSGGPTTPESAAKSKMVAEHAMHLISEAVSADGGDVLLDDRVESIVMDGMVTVLEGRCGAMAWRRVWKELSDGDRWRAFLVSGSLDMIMRRREAPPKYLCEWLFRKACLDSDDEVAESAASALYSLMGRQDCPWSVSRELFEGCVMALGVEDGILALGREGGGKGKLEEEEEREVRGVCAGVRRGVGLYATSLGRSQDPARCKDAIDLAIFMSVLPMITLLPLLTAPTCTRTILNALMDFVGSLVQHQETLVCSPFSPMVQAAAWTWRGDLGGWGEMRRRLAGWFCLEAGGCGGFYVEAGGSAGLVSPTISPSKEEGGGSRQPNSLMERGVGVAETPCPKSLRPDDIVLADLLGLLKEYRVAPPTATDYRKVAARVRVLGVAIGGTDGARAEHGSSVAIAGVLKALYTRINDARLAFVNRTVAKHELYILKTILEVCLPSVQKTSQAKLNFVAKPVTSKNFGDVEAGMSLGSL
ncbi:hypothetical protein BC829DRAFT_439269 [Chytridium lagenaria]|nr:hypothetical protein BC829DRAFT_439269 [Chytridium lagenaria]